MGGVNEKKRQKRDEREDKRKGRCEERKRKEGRKGKWGQKKWKISLLKLHHIGFTFKGGQSHQSRK